jgi:hypothetical protein
MPPGAAWKQYCCFPGGFFMKMQNVAAVFCAAFLIAAVPGRAAAQTISGTLDSRASFSAGSGSAPAFFWGFEELANVRLQARIRDRAVFYSAVNVIAAGGFPAKYAELTALAAAGTGSPALTGTPFVAGKNAIVALELERLYFRVSGETVNFDLGLMRLPLGYSLVWGPSDFLNPRDPLSTNARPRGILGANAAFFPGGDLKIFTFAAAGKDPFAEDGGGVIAGLGAENHWSRASAQGLYSYETPAGGTPYGVHRAGFSLKADLELGFVAELMFTWNPGNSITVAGLSACGGFDYSFLDGSCYVLLEYLWSGAESSTALLLGLSGRNYIQALFRYRFNDYTSAGAVCTAALDDRSFRPGLVFDHDFFQGMSLNLTVTVPLDQDLFGGGTRGEFGPLPPLLDGYAALGLRRGSYADVTATVRLKW